ncbi:MAG: cytochrome c oxidase subunit 3 [Myxococcaceae bacterium]|jgi:cytochrome c oxidase subunit 3|nr:cytochrome c oxidase subunit 3 [Myxococcaceae bacterium]
MTTSAAALTTSPPANRPVVPNAVLGTLIFVVAEVMFFVGLISAFTISRAGAPAGTWPVPGQPLLPAEATALNTAALMLSGALLLAGQVLWAKKRPVARWVVLAAWVLGALFVVLQGREWSQLLSAGLTMKSSRLGAFFYLIVGTHGVHAIGALVALGLAAVQVLRGRLEGGLFFGAQVFWYFVVLMWPIIYARVYF